MGYAQEELHVARPTLKVPPLTLIQIHGQLPQRIGPPECLEFIRLAHLALGSASRRNLLSDWLPLYTAIAPKTSPGQSAMPSGTLVTFVGPTSAPR